MTVRACQQGRQCRQGRQCQQGSVTLLVVVVGVMVAALAAAGLRDVATVVAARAQSSAAADAAALAGAIDLGRGADVVPGAREAATRNGAELVRSRIDQTDWTVSVRVRMPVRLLTAGTRTVTASARAVAEFAGDPRLGDPQRLLANPGLLAGAQMRADIAAGRIDPRILGIIEWIIARGHTVTVSSLLRKTYVKGTNRQSNHWFGRAVDIGAIDGKAVRDDHAGAREIVRAFDAIRQAGMRPTELGSPWTASELFVSGGRTARRGGTTFFNNADHEDHIHVGFRE